MEHIKAIIEKMLKEGYPKMKQNAYIYNSNNNPSGALKYRLLTKRKESLKNRRFRRLISTVKKGFLRLVKRF